MNRILITGCSSGFGLATALHFLDQGWDVVATMRSPRAGLLPDSPNLSVLPLDVTDPASIAACLAAAGPLDALVNNAGIGWLNAHEGTSDAVVRRLFETNTFGTMAMTRAVLPQMRERGAGVVVNVTSTVTLMSIPLLSAYTASKAAVNAFTEALAGEIAPHGIRARLVLPGRAPATAFATTARAGALGEVVFPPAYAAQVDEMFARWSDDPGPVTTAQDVAEAVWRAVTDPAAPIRLPAGADAVELAARVRGA